ncbi:MAG TPA: hypothetical protein VEI99_10385 [Terriglobales bacterium]|nr:hypothetical protein [Terriglobales bacterium]
MASALSLLANNSDIAEEASTAAKAKQASFRIREHVIADTDQDITGGNLTAG